MTLQLSDNSRELVNRLIMLDNINAPHYWPFVRCDQWIRTPHSHSDSHALGAICLKYFNMSSYIPRIRRAGWYHVFMSKPPVAIHLPSCEWYGRDYWKGTGGLGSNWHPHQLWLHTELINFFGHGSKLKRTASEKLQICSFLFIFLFLATF